MPKVCRFQSSQPHNWILGIFFCKFIDTIMTIKSDRLSGALACDERSINFIVLRECVQRTIPWELISFACFYENRRVQLSPQMRKCSLFFPHL